MKVSKFIPVFTAVMVAVGLWGFGLVGDATAIEGVCVAGCDPPPPTSTSTPTQPQGPTPEELEREREAEVHDWNDEGFEAYQRGDWANAVKYFEKALEYDPYNPALVNNLNAAREKLQGAEKEARKQVESAKDHGKKAQDMTLEGASREAQRVFDRQGVRVPSSGDAVDARGLERPAEIPDAVANHPDWIKLENREKRLRAEYESKSRELDKLQAKRTSGGGNKSSLLLDIAQKKAEVFKLEADMNQVKYEKEKMLSFPVDFLEKKDR